MRKIAIAAILASAALAGCASQPSYGPAVSESRTYDLQNSVNGKILSVRKVTITRDSKGGYALAGALVGGVAGNAIGSGAAKTLATVGGALAGGAAGHYLGSSAGQKPGVEISVEAERGSKYVVIQEDQGEGFQVNERVQVVFANGYSRVVR